MKKQNTPQLVLPLFLFALSGLSSLVYESLWIRTLSLGVGSTSTALSIVLAIFFSGLALGSFWAGRQSASLRNPLRTYALLEAGISVCSFLIIFPLVRFQSILAMLPAAMTSTHGLLVFSKFLLVFLLLIVPTLAMGASFPVLTQYFLLRRERGRTDRSLELLYGANTLGAVVGAFATSFLLIPSFGVRNSNFFAAALSLLVAALAFYFAQPAGVTREADSELKLKATQDSPVRKEAPLSLWTKILLAVAGVVGFCSIGAEVVWNKYLGIFFGTNLYGLGLILTFFLLGIALGSFILAAFTGRYADRRRVLIYVILGALLATFVSSRLLNEAPVAASILAHYLAPHISLLAIKCVLAACVLFLPTALFGAIFPLAIRVAADDSGKLAHVSGLAYALNTLGAVLASSLVGIFLIPKLGSPLTLRICFLLLALSAGALIYFDAKLVRRERVRLASLAAGLLVLTMVFSAFDFRNIIKSAYEQALDGNTPFAEVLKTFTQDFEDFKLIVEGETAVISLSNDPQDGPDYKRFLRLKSNGLNESVYSIDNMSALPKYEALLGFLPYLFVRSPQNAFVVGYGGGCTTDFLTRSSLKQVEVVELERGVLDAAQLVYNYRNPIFERRSLDLKIEDARYVLASQPKKRYDIIVSQPSHSWLSGVANLFTEDFFRIVQSRLSQKGVFSQWLNLYNINEETLKSILHTFYSVFPNGAVFTDYGDTQMIMVGSMQPLVLNLQKLSLLAGNQILHEQLQYMPFAEPADLISDFSLGRTQVMALTKDSPLNTDDNAFAELRQSALFYETVNPDLDAQHFLRRNYTADYSDVLPEAESSNKELLLSIIKAMHRNHKFDKLFIETQKLESLASQGDDLQNTVAQALFLGERYQSAYSRASAELAHHANPQSVKLNLELLAEMGRYVDLLQVAQKHLAQRTKESLCYENLARLESDPKWATGPASSRLLENAEKLKAECGPLSQKIIGQLQLVRGQNEKAQASLEEYVAAFPSDPEILKKLAGLPNSPEKTTLYQNKLAAEQERLTKLAAFFRRHQLEGDALVLDARLQKLL